MVVYRKTGFDILSGPVIIHERDTLFFDTTKIRGIKSFNLPKGEYKILRGKISVRNSPVFYEKLYLEPRERNRKLPTDFKIIFERNPHKCLIDWFKKVVIFDTSFKNRPRNELIFIYAHELAHAFFKSEEEADKQAHNFMLDLGFNPSQIIFVPFDTLENSKRKNQLINLYNEKYTK